MSPVEISHQSGWIHLWLECDSILVPLAFKSQKINPMHFFLFLPKKIKKITAIFFNDFSKGVFH